MRSRRGYRRWEWHCTRPVIVPHRVAALAEAISGCDADMILILTGSATSDAMDVAPEALRAAGGEVTRFGMPVDPGNLLFIGQPARRRGDRFARVCPVAGAEWCRLGAVTTGVRTCGDIC